MTEIYEWLTSIGYEVKGRPYAIDAAPYIRRPFEYAKDPNVRRLVMPCPVQSGKSLFAQGVVLYRAKWHPSNCMYYAQDVPNTEEFSETRMRPDLRKYAPEMLRSGPNAVKKALVVYRNGKWLTMLSGENRKNLQSRSSPLVISDEAAMMHDGRLDEAERRTEAFQQTIAKHILISTPEDEDTDFHLRWEASTKEEWHLDCPKCSRPTRFDLKAFAWTEDEITRPNGRWRISEVERTVRWRCRECEHEIPADSPQFRDLRLEAGRYVETNPDADPQFRGCHYSGFAVPWKSPTKLVIRFLEANVTAKKGNLAPLREFIRKDLGEFWRHEEFIERPLHISGGYMMGADWDGEHSFPAPGGGKIRCRNLTVDVQKDHFYCVIRSWGEGGDSRLIWVEIVPTWQHIEELRKRFEVIPHRTFVDAGWKRYGARKGDNEVYRMCHKFGWWAIKGADEPDFPVGKDAAGNTVRRPWSLPELRNAGLGSGRAQHCRFMFFSVPTMSAHLDKLKGGESSVSWGLPDDVPEFYRDQICNVIAIERKDGKGVQWENIGDDHCFDAEKMQLVPAYGDGLFSD